MTYYILIIWKSSFMHFYKFMTLQYIDKILSVQPTQSPHSYSIIALKWKWNDLWSAGAKECREEHSDSPDLQATKLQGHPITDLTGMILHVITAHLSYNMNQMCQYYARQLYYTVKILWGSSGLKWRRCCFPAWQSGVGLWKNPEPNCRSFNTQIRSLVVNLVRALYRFPSTPGGLRWCEIKFYTS